MKSKKTNKANLEKSKPTMLLIGLVLSLAMVLESFEWLGSDYISTSLESNLVADVDNDIITEVEIFVPKKKTEVQPQKTKTKQVVVVKTPIVASGPPVITKKEIMPDIDWDAIDDGGSDDDGGDIVTIDSVFIIVEDMPEFPGGIKALYSYLGENIKYPTISAEAGSQGQAYVNFTIEKNGKISDVKTVGGSADNFCKKEAVRVVGEMPKWKPGKQRGKKVRVSYTLPVRFVLNN